MMEEVTLRGIGTTSFLLYNASTWEWWHYIVWIFAILFALELLTQVSLAFNIFNTFSPIPQRGKHLDNLTIKDQSFIWFNKLVTALFTYQLLQFVWFSTNFYWYLHEITILNTLVVLVVYFIIYDFFYTIFHYLLHRRGIYQYIHKHHHRQMAPSRGNTDAINVHPFEFLSGEYNHLLTIYLVSNFIITPHVYTVLLFTIIGGILASLNHTRYDIKFPVFPLVYQVKYHDIHHWFPTANFGQYTMFWDHVFGWFKPYPK